MEMVKSNTYCLSQQKIIWKLKPKHSLLLLILYFVVFINFLIQGPAQKLHFIL